MKKKILTGLFAFTLGITMFPGTAVSIESDLRRTIFQQLENADEGYSEKIKGYDVTVGRYFDNSIKLTVSKKIIKGTLEESYTLNLIDYDNPTKPNIQLEGLDEGIWRKGYKQEESSSAHCTILSKNELKEWETFFDEAMYILLDKIPSKEGYDNRSIKKEIAIKKEMKSLFKSK